MSKIKEPPVNEVLEMEKRGLEQDEIYHKLKSKGYNSTQISEAINQAKMKQPIDEPPVPPEVAGMEPSSLDQQPEAGAEAEIPSPEEEISSSIPTTHQVKKTGREEIAEIAEAIVEEKWQQIVASIGDLETWKVRVEDDITAIKQEIIRISNHFNSLQNSIAGKISEYSEGMTEVSSEIKALEKILQNIINPLSMNVKELSRITKELKK